jgi:hypothetical protein
MVSCCSRCTQPTSAVRISGSDIRGRVYVSRWPATFSDTTMSAESPLSSGLPRPDELVEIEQPLAGSHATTSIISASAIGVCVRPSVF